MEDVEGCIREFIRSKGEAMVSVSEARDNPYYNMVEPNSDNAPWVKPVMPQATRIRNSQDIPKVWAINGAVYVFSRESLLSKDNQFEIERYGVYEMPWERSIDIDTPFDLEMAEFLINRKV